MEHPRQFKRREEFTLAEILAHQKLFILESSMTSLKEWAAKLPEPRTATMVRMEMDRANERAAEYAERCRHCGKPNRVRQGIARSEFDEWAVTRIGPAGKWLHCYCSEECASHRDEYSAREWRRL